jgi:hypothetical protein
MIDDLRRGPDARFARVAEISRSLDALGAQLGRVSADLRALVGDLLPGSGRASGTAIHEERRRGAPDRRSGDERRRARPEGVVARVLVAAERRGRDDRRSGNGRRRDDRRPS